VGEEPVQSKALLLPVFLFLLFEDFFGGGVEPRASCMQGRFSSCEFTPELPPLTLEFPEDFFSEPEPCHCFTIIIY
jgi:hypothetical protein